jgi:tetratricopeptide (TPR) repeat protein
MMRTATALLLALIVLDGTARADAPADAKKLRTQATKLYKAKKYAEACPLFEQAVAKTPADQAIQLDLGLCRARAGDAKGAALTLRSAVGAGDRAIRLKAYFNLGEAGVKVDVPAPRKCVELAASSGCGRGLLACGFAYEACGAGSCQTGTGVRVYDRPLFGTRLEPDAEEAWKKRFAAKKPCDANEETDDDCFLRLEEDPPVFDQPLASLHKAAEAGDATTTMPAVIDLKLEERWRDDVTRCTLVHADACTGAVGLVCQEPRSPKVAVEWLVDVRAPDDVKP